MFVCHETFILKVDEWVFDNLLIARTGGKSGRYWVRILGMITRVSSHGGGGWRLSPPQSLHDQWLAITWSGSGTLEGRTRLSGGHPHHFGSAQDGLTGIKPDSSRALPHHLSALFATRSPLCVYCVWVSMCVNKNQFISGIWFFYDSLHRTISFTMQQVPLPRGAL